MTTAELLREARGFIAKGWTQGAFARLGDGDVTIVIDPRAASWCALGAVATANLVGVAARAATRDAASRYLRKAACGADVTHYNDSLCKTQADALAWFDRAIELAESEGGDQ